MQLAQRPVVGPVAPVGESTDVRSDERSDSSTSTPQGMAGLGGATPAHAAPTASAVHAGGSLTAEGGRRGGTSGGRPLYTAEERERRDRSKWTKVQGVLAALQFFVFLASVVLVLRTLLTGEGLFAANVSVVAKTMTLYAIMVTGALWEHDVYGKYLFAEAFFWEDVVSMGVIALHTAYLVALIGGSLDARALMLLALAAYATYVINAGQFLVKFRRARLDRKKENAMGGGATTAAPPSAAVEGAR